MKSEQILTADLLDILFENRNKAYGAYSIRKAYPSHLKKAMATMLLLVGVASVIVMSQPKKPVDRAVTIHLKPDHEFDKVKEIEKPKEKKTEERTVAEQPPTKPDFVPKIVDDDKVVNEVPDRTDTAKYNPGPIEDPGTPGGEELIQANKGAEINITPTPPQTPAPEEPAIVEHPDENPEFPGGMAAWTKYLQRMLRVPDELESGDRKTVRVKFVVNLNGEVTDVVISQSAGKEFDKEVLRVIGHMPKWKPGKQRGKPVASYFTQPVTFTAPEE
ncbi:energy transducer TonB [Lacibacter sp. H407]|uniref:energy transducer TonB n=1 Tax=Lacibacter sp. H407 TaxID=3133423 RepID=UPI0030C0169B